MTDTLQIVPSADLSSLFHEKVQNALKAQHVEASEFAEIYLVNLLATYHASDRNLHDGGEELFEKPLALMLLEANEGDDRNRIARLKQVGDSALIISGFFSDSIRKSLVDLPYYISIGGSAFATLADMHDKHATFADLYQELSLKFAAFVDVLATIAPWNHAFTNEELLQLYMRWIQSGDERLRQFLERRGIDTSAGTGGKKPA